MKVQYSICQNCGFLITDKSCGCCGAEQKYKSLESQNDNLLYAVRYGFQYRKEAERHSGQSESLHFFLPPPNEVLLWIGNAVMSGIAYDILKEGVKKNLKIRS